MSDVRILIASILSVAYTEKFFSNSCESMLIGSWSYRNLSRNPGNTFLPVRIVMLELIFLSSSASENSPQNSSVDDVFPSLSVCSEVTLTSPAWNFIWLSIFPNIKSFDWKRSYFSNPA